MNERVFVREKLAALAQYPEADTKRPPNSPSSVVIIGGGAVGLAAADMLRRKGYDGSVTMISNLRSVCPSNNGITRKGWPSCSPNS